MLIRFVIENLYSFGDRKEINTIPNNRIKSLDHHKINFEGFNLLKMTSVYGANGAGKSNVIKSLSVFKDLILNEDYLPRLSNLSFKFNSDKKPNNQLLVIEFIAASQAYYYGIEVVDNIIRKEELYKSGLGKTSDFLIYERNTNQDKKSSITFFEEFEKNKKNQILKEVLLEDFVRPNEPILKLLSRRDNNQLSDIKNAFNWFKNSLTILSPHSKPVGLTHNISINEEFENYANSLMNSLNLGINSIHLDKSRLSSKIEDKETLDKIVDEFDAMEDPDNQILLYTDDKDIEYCVSKEEDELWVSTIQLEHEGKKNIKVKFEQTEESDGTRRLLDFVPAFYEVIKNECVYVIDEIERSIHPLLIKELLRKFSLDNKTKGQLIFSTHESNLLDLDIFRQDEIWFTEKDKDGNSDLYPLSDFKEHKTIDIRKGYLNGRYGSIPFLSNLKDLNWDTDVIEK